MTYPTISGTAGNVGSSAASHSITIPSGTSGELLVAIIAYSGSPTPSMSGWSSVSTGADRTVVFKKTASTASEAANTVTWSGGNTAIAYIVIRSNAQDVEATGTSGVNNIDPPSHVASWGAADHLWLATMQASTDNYTVTGTPTNYSTSVAESGATGAGTAYRIVSYSRQYNATDTQDPSTFAFTGTASNRRATTLVFRTPAATNPTIDSTTKLESGQSFVITGSTFGASAGTNGRVRLSTTDSSASGTDQTGLTWADTSITVASANIGGAADGTTLYLFVRNDSSQENSSGFAVPVADIVLRVGSGVLTDTLKDTDAGTDIGSEACARMIVISGAAGSEVIAQSYTDAVITSGVLEYDDSALYNVSTEGDTFQVAIQGNSATRLGFLPAIVVDRNDD